MVSTHLKNISQNGNLPQIGVKIKNIPNHHLVINIYITYILNMSVSLCWEFLWCDCENVMFSFLTPEAWKTWTPGKGDSDPTWNLSDFKGFHVKKFGSQKKTTRFNHASWCSAASAALAQELPAASGKIWAFASKSIWTHAAWPRLAHIWSMGINTVPPLWKKPPVFHIL